MKKFIVVIIMIMAFASTSFAQLVVNPNGYTDVCTFCMGSGAVRYTGGKYFLCGETDNRFEDCFATILLGNSKESAIATLKDLEKILKKEISLKEPISTIGMNGRTTTIFKCQGTAAIETEGVAGMSFIIFHLKNKFNDLIDAINAFDEA